MIYAGEFLVTRFFKDENACNAGNRFSFRAGFAVRNGKRSLNQETGLGNRGPLEALIDIKLILLK